MRDRQQTESDEGDDQRWLRLELVTKRPDADSATLMEIDALGVEVQDRQTYMEGVETAAVPAGKTRLIAYFEARRSTAELRRLVDEKLNDVEIISVADYSDRSWETAWMKYFGATRLSKRVAVGPPWDIPEEPENGLSLVIEPGMAFGTGTHETTRSCAQILDDILSDHPVASVLDVGCGSAILSMLASGLGVDKVVGIDIDKRAVGVARTNIKENGFSADDIQLSSTPLAKISDTFQIVIANILAVVLIDLRDDLLGVVDDGGHLILSGISEKQLDDVRAEFEHPEFEEIEVLADGPWRTIDLRRHRSPRQPRSER